MRKRLTPRNQRGAALILALGILALLTFVAFAFATLTRTELRASLNYRDGERARYAAWSGVERAKYELRRAVQTPGYPLPYILPDTFNYATKTFETPAVAEKFDALEPGDPAVATRHPSLGCHFETVPAALADTHLPWPSGILGGTYYSEPAPSGTGGAAGLRFRGDYYVLRITDTSSLINLNDQSPHLEAMLDRLGAVTGAGNVGSKILLARKNARGYLRRVEELQGVLNESEYGKIERFVTTAAAVDTKVIENGKQGSGSGMARLQPLPRAPINVNLAPREVLLAALHGMGWRDARGDFHSLDGSDPVNSKLAKLVDKIIQYRTSPTIPISDIGNPLLIGSGTRRYGFQSWPEFAQFLTTIAGLSPDEAGCVLANANPNTDINKFVPDQSIYHSVDKSDLILGSTEFCFAPSGVFIIESLGVILGPDGRCVAQAKARSVVRVFERYVETTQADFEANRIDPEAAVTAFRGLRDVTTLPEFRNNSTALIDPTKTLKDQETQTGLHAANYDGQVTFNVITQVRISREGLFQGFIDGTFNGLLLPSKSPVKPEGGIQIPANTPTPPTGTPIGLMVEVNDVNLDRWNKGSDVHPFAGYLGRPRLGGASNGRVIQFPQETTINQSARHYEVPETILTMPVRQTISFTGGGGIAGVINFNLVSRIQDYGYDAIENQGFEMWFKPSVDAALDGRRTQVLLDWHSGPPETVELSATDMLRNGVATANSTTFNTAFFAGVLNSFASNDRTNDKAVNYGMQVYLAVWLEAVEGPNGYETYTLRAKFRGDKPSPGLAAQSKFTGRYEKTWNYSGQLAAGTWHHWLLTFSQPPRGQEAATPSRRHVTFWADGLELNAVNGDPAWPTEITAQGQLIKQTIEDFKNIIAEVMAAEQASGPVGGAATIIMNAPTYVINFNEEDYRVPAIIPVNWDGFTHVGHQDPEPCFTEISGASRFLGLVDNLILQNNWIRKIDKSVEFPNESYIRRYDTWRPSVSVDTADNLEDAIIYRKHTPALEWQRPIKIIGYEATTWRNAPNLDDKSYIELGRVYIHFGWKRAGDPVPLDVNGNYPTGLQPDGTPMTPSGWTGRLDQRPFNAVGGVYMIPDREGQFSGQGFLTRPAGGGSGTTSGSSIEEYNYALEIKPVLDAQSGPRMAPVIDDVTVIYMPWDAASVISEDEIID